MNRWLHPKIVRRVAALGAVLLFCAASAATATAQETERLYLSGTGLGDTRDWEFQVSAGLNAGVWSTIPVPSQWELAGFGSYAYGFEDDKPHEEGSYRYRFTLPDTWEGRRLRLTFEGVMTDTAARLNSVDLTPIHRGGFTRFSYDVTDEARAGESNLLEVLVREHSTDRSINRAERDADYWVFGGIFRPVYLESFPAASIDDLAVDARHDGTLSLAVRTAGEVAGCEVTAELATLEGTVIGTPLRTAVKTGEVTALTAHVDGVEPWSAEDPNLYELDVRLFCDGRIAHRVAERIGFRSVELRPGVGLFVNGSRVRLKGINRHSFWPRSGRTLNRALNRADARLIKSMNMNAVRASHYPPDTEFLDACDELGLYVLDELPGWHDAYGTEVGSVLVEELVNRDRNHPSIIAWNNGNEGGWNRALDRLFGEHDPQDRPVLHPGEEHGGVDANHYPSWDELRRSLDPKTLASRWQSLFGPLPLVLPTEVLHGLYDGGLGAGLADFWHLITSSPRGLGLFLWAFVDEAVVRHDRGGELDTHGNYAPDGIVGPYRQPEGSFQAVREIFSPVGLPARTLGEDFDGRIQVLNRFDMTDLAACRFDWAWLDFPHPLDAGGAEQAREAGSLAGPAAPPGGAGEIEVELPDDWRQRDALRVTAYGPRGDEIFARVYPVRGRAAAGRRWVERGAGTATASQRGDLAVLRAGEVEAEFDATSGELRRLRRGDRTFSLGNGPRLADGAPSRLLASRVETEGDTAVFRARYAAGLEGGSKGGLELATWRLYPSGWLRLAYQYELERPHPFAGVRFDYPEELVRGARWLGDGPSRVWGNRTAGGRLGVWRRTANDAVTGERWDYPEFKGYYADLYWAELDTGEGRLSLVLEADDLYLSLFQPAFPNEPRNAIAPAPPGIALLNAIPAIGTKFHPADELGPAGASPQPGLYRGVVSFYLHPAEVPGSAP